MQPISFCEWEGLRMWDQEGYGLHAAASHQGLGTGPEKRFPGRRFHVNQNSG